MNCPNCTAPLPLDRIDRTAMYVRCDWCDTSVRLNALDPPAAVETALKPRISRPTDLSVNRTGDALHIAQSTVKPRNLGAAAFMIIWLIILFGMGTAAAQFAPGGFVTLIVIGMAAFGLIGLVKSVGGSVQRLDINISPTALTVQQRGMFPGPTIHEPRDGIRQFWVEEDFVSISDARERNGQPIARYALNVLRRDHSKRRLATFHDRETALYLEQEIEKFLGIQDRPVKGEYAS